MRYSRREENRELIQERNDMSVSPWKEGAARTASALPAGNAGRGRWIGSRVAREYLFAYLPKPGRIAKRAEKGAIFLKWRKS